MTIGRRKLFELLAEHIEAQIIAGKLKPGEQLPPERELQAVFGVGRPAVREALIALERAGMIEIGNGARSKVAQPSAANLLSSIVSPVKHLLSTPEGNNQFQAVRLLIEEGLVRKAAREATPEFIRELRSAFEQNCASIGVLEDFIRTDVAFHYTIARFAGEPAILAIHQAMSGWLSAQREVSLRMPGAAEQATKHHARILEAIEARDPALAEEAMRAHLTDVRAYYEQSVGES